MKNAYDKLIEMFMDRAESMNITVKARIDPDGYTRLTHIFGPKKDVFVDILIHTDLLIELIVEIGIGCEYEIPYSNDNVTVKECYDLIKKYYLDYQIDLNTYDLVSNSPFGDI
jgi:hypothetical protein